MDQVDRGHVFVRSTGLAFALRLCRASPAPWPVPRLRRAVKYQNRVKTWSCKQLKVHTDRPTRRAHAHFYGVRPLESTGTKDQLQLGHIGLLRICERSTVASRCSLRTTVADFGPKCPY